MTEHIENNLKELKEIAQEFDELGKSIDKDKDIIKEMNSKEIDDTVKVLNRHPSRSPFNRVTMDKRPKRVKI